MELLLGGLVCVAASFITLAVGLLVVDPGGRLDRSDYGARVAPNRLPVAAVGFTPVDMGTTALPWPSEVPQRARALPPLPWPSETWTDDWFTKGRRGREAAPRTGSDRASDLAQAQRRRDQQAREDRLSQRRQAARDQRRQSPALEARAREGSNQQRAAQQQAAQQRQAQQQAAQQRAAEQRAAQQQAAQQRQAQQRAAQQRAAEERAAQQRAAQQRQAQQRQAQQRQAPQAPAQPAPQLDGPPLALVTRWVDEHGLAGAVERVRAETGWDFQKAAQYLAGAMRSRKR